MPDALSPCLFSISKWGYLNATEGDYSPPSSGFIFISDYGHVVLQSVATGVQGQRGTGVWCVSSSIAHWSRSPLGNRSKSARSLTRKISLLGLSASEWRLYRGREWTPHRSCGAAWCWAEECKSYFPLKHELEEWESRTPHHSLRSSHLCPTWGLTDIYFFNLQAILLLQYEGSGIPRYLGIICSFSHIRDILCLATVPTNWGR